jgi:hypothetical protein
MKTPHYHRFSFINSFGSRQLKDRIKMMNAPQVHRWRYVCMALVLGLVFCFSGCESEAIKINKYVYEHQGTYYWIMSPKATDKDLTEIRRILSKKFIYFEAQVARNRLNEVFYGKISAGDSQIMLREILKSKRQKQGIDNNAGQHIGFDMGKVTGYEGIKPFAFSCKPFHGIVTGIDPEELPSNIRKVLIAEQPTKYPLAYYALGNGEMFKQAFDIKNSFRIPKKISIAESNSKLGPWRLYIKAQRNNFKHTKVYNFTQLLEDSKFGYNRCPVTVNGKYLDLQKGQENTQLYIDSLQVTQAQLQKIHVRQIHQISVFEKPNQKMVVVYLDAKKATRDPAKQMITALYQGEQ